ncbi:ribosome-associated ATPase/putative transporter RbbA [Sphingomonas sp.]|uniref:ribosome-associated ATPase/putative transporter RbbA n=1 Tax=Sphingomonas sp. TaxID=28214 RepID=UPI0025F5CC1F|nr:ribosome-associated ATPase/putative transporter RbbA [Sphingomonas sp.]
MIPPVQSLTEEAIRIESLSHRYGGIIALNDVSLSLPKGKTTALVGPDGVGKSTLLGLISGVKKLQKGSLSVLGFDLGVRHRREDFLSRVAYMPQGLGRNLYPTLSVRENIDFFGRLFGLSAIERETHMRRLLDATGLAPFPDRPAGKLSGGMKQKLGLCCSLVHDPDLLILDEPTTGVDPLSRRQFWELVDAMCAERPDMTVLVSTAYMEEAERFGHLVAMDDGKVIAQGDTREIMRNAGADTLEAAYVRLLPQDKRPSGDALIVPPWRDQGKAPAIEAHDLTRRFGDFVAVDHVNFRIGRGEIFGFLGSNGCGKTTTMKMLTGLLDATGGTASLFGRPIAPGDMETRMRVGYMSQAFSLYEELSVRQNLVLHARLYRVPRQQAGELVSAALAQFELEAHADAVPAALPLGIRQRLQLAAACLHRPEILILDEPTSGVDPAARDMFWRHLIRLSRDEGVTIFVSTHFMNEAERCDRISLMHRGRVLAVGTPAELTQRYDAQRLEDAFITVLEKDNDEAPTAAAPLPVDASVSSSTPAAGARSTAPGRPRLPTAAGGWPGFVWAFARREATELMRDHIRLAFALIGPIILLCIAAYSISFDVQNIRLAVLDHDRSAASRDLQLYFAGSRYFRVEPELRSDTAADQALREASAKMVLDIPPGFGRDLVAGRRPAVDVRIDGASPFPASNARAYAEAVFLRYAIDQLRPTQLFAIPDLSSTIEPRFIYNQEFRSIYAMAPGVLMLCMILIPAMLTALGVVREKEIGSITNLYASPASLGAFLVGKQTPYALLAMISFVMLILVTVFILGVGPSDRWLPLHPVSHRARADDLRICALAGRRHLRDVAHLSHPVGELLRATLSRLDPRWTWPYHRTDIPLLLVPDHQSGHLYQGPGHSQFRPSLSGPAGARIPFRRRRTPGAGKTGEMTRWILNVALLSGKELRSVMKDVTLMALILFAFTVAIQLVANGVRAEVMNASVAIMDQDHSELSRRLREAIQQPYFKPPENIERSAIGPAMDSGQYIFVIEIPPRFEADTLAGRSPSVQILVDATAMTQAGLGAAYFQQIFAQETLDFLHARGLLDALPVKVESRMHFNPNAQSAWYTSVMQIVTNVTVLSIILVGAAVIREREHGTIEHLLVMPVRASEIAFAKILANGLVILLASIASLWFVVHGVLGVPLTGSLPLFTAAMFLYLFSVTSLGMWMATLAPSMPQFGLFAVPVYAIAYLLSGAATPLESMPPAVRTIALCLPTTQFVSLSQAILYRGAGLRTILPELAIICGSGVFFVAMAVNRFRSMLSRQG